MKKIRNVRFALRGIHIAWQEEFSFKVQIAAMALTILLGWYFTISPIEWVAVILAIGFVLTAEAFNTALEELCDKFKTDLDPHVGKIKDLAAGAVLIASFAALLVGLIVLAPRIISLA